MTHPTKTGIEEPQLINYLKATKLPLGLLINFGGTQLQWKRYANTRIDREGKTNE